jgi:uncharacterized protein (PEP-CTERM system associated)
VLRCATAVFALAAAACAPTSGAQTWRITPAVGWESTLTDNVELTSNGRSDWVNQFTPGVSFSSAGARTHLTGIVSVPIMLYARTSENNHVFPQASIKGSYEAIDDFLFIDANINVSQQFVTPFGARSTSLANATDNRYTAQSYSVSPYIKGTALGDVTYELRNTSTWSDANVSSIGGNSYTNEIVGRLMHEPTPAGWSLEYDRADVRFSSQESEITEIGRARGTWLLDPTFDVSATVGYEDNRFSLTSERGVVYGTGLRWRPNERTSANASWEHRFFGAAYDVAFNHTTRLTVWSIAASRNITSYPQQLATLPVGGDVRSLLNALFASRLTDPNQRQTFVDQLIRDRGLPTVLTGPVPLLARQITLVESATATAGILGARNSILFSVYRSRSEPVEGEDFGLLPLGAVDSTQLGASASWTHQITPTLTLGTIVDWSRARDNAQTGGVTRLYAVRAFLSTPLSALTSVYGGARFQDSRSNIADSYREAAVYVGLAHTFH